MEFKFDYDVNKEKLMKLDEIIKANSGQRGALMNVLHQAQHLFGFLPLEIQEIISSKMYIPLSEIYGVVTFYSQFSLTPKGKYEIGVCEGTACYVKGSQAIKEKVCENLNISVGETTPDLNFSMQATRCIGACGLAPVMTIGGDVYGKLKAGDIDEILKKYQDK